MKYLLYIVIAFTCLSVNAKKTENKDAVPGVVSKINSSGKLPYYVLLPQNFDPEKRYWLFVIVHGYKKDGTLVSSGSEFIYKDQCIFVGPSFANGYQTLGSGSVRQLDSIVKEMKKKYKLHDRFMLQGHSGGAQFTHRYAMKSHKNVLACISSSAGSWGGVSSSAKYLPFLLSCGELDTKKSTSMSPYGRLAWFRRYRNAVIKGKYFYSTQVVPGEGHGARTFYKKEQGPLFKLVTTGLWPKQLIEFEKKLNETRQIISASDAAKARRALSDLSRFKPTALEYTKQAIDDTDAKERQKTHLINEYGYTMNSKAERYLAERFQYYLKNILIPKLTKKP